MSKTLNVEVTGILEGLAEELRTLDTAKYNYAGDSLFEIVIQPGNVVEIHETMVGFVVASYKHSGVISLWVNKDGQKIAREKIKEEARTLMISQIGEYALADFQCKEESN